MCIHVNDLKELFAATADDAPPPRGLVATAHARAAARRTTTRRRVAGAVTAGVAVVAAGSVALRPETKPAYVALGADGIARVAESGERCRGYSGRVPGSEMPPALRLVSDDPDLRQVRPAFARRMSSNCHAAAVPLALARVGADGRTERALLLSGPLPAPVTPGYADDSRPVTVRGVRGTLLLPQGRVSGVTWREPGGRGWLLHSTGLDEAALLAYAERIELGEDGSATLPGPHGFRDLGTIPERRGLASHVWYLTYRNAAGHEVEIEASEHAGPVGTFLIGVPADLSREVTVNGTRAVWFTNGDRFGHGLQLLQWEVSPGVLGSVSGVGLTFDELMELATSVRPAPDGHPAVTTAE